MSPETHLSLVTNNDERILVKNRDNIDNASCDSGRKYHHHNEDDSPIFILGYYRSGTTAISDALKGIGYFGWREGYVFPLVYKLHDLIDDHLKEVRNFNGPDFAVSAINPDKLKSDIINSVADIYKTDANNIGWFDKTPGWEMVSSAPRLLSFWPKAKFIFCKRRGIDNIESQIRRFGDPTKRGISFRDLCYGWSRTMEAWTLVKDTLGDAAIEMEHHDLASTPSAIAEKLAQFLKIDGEYKRKLAEILTNNYPEKTATNFSWKPLDMTDWSKKQQDDFLSICGPAMNEYGYPIGGNLDRFAIKVHMINYSRQPENVEITNVSNEDDYRPLEPGTFLLHPQAIGGAAKVSFINVNLTGHSSFTSRLEIRHRESASVVYRVVIVDSENGHCYADQTVTLDSHSPVNWSFQFPPVSSLCRIELSTEMSAEAPNNFYAWACWISPRLSVSITD